MRKISFLIAFLGVLCGAFARETPGSNYGDVFDPSQLAMHHVLDSHQWHIADIGDEVISIPLPIILWDDGLVVFMSSAFEHGSKVVGKNGNFYKIYHEKIYKTDAQGILNMDKDNHPTNAIPLNFSITKNVASMFFSVLLLVVLFSAAARSYKSEIPTGVGRFLEPLITFVRDDIAIANIGEKKYKRFMPYLLTVFFFIWINNIMGLLPIPPGGGANVTGNIAITMVLALITFLLTTFSGSKDYWKHIFDPLGSSFPTMGKVLLYIILIPVEIIGMFTKPFALTVRLFANITAGHILILCITSLVFVFQTSLVALATVPFVLFMNCIELLVAFLQAYIFTLLSALFIGLAVKRHEHHTEKAH